MSTEITVLTFNLWGIFNSKHCQERMAHFATKVANFDVVLLQEQFSESDFELIIRNLPSEIRRTRYFRRFPTAFYGSGIAVISRFPIKSTLFFVFPLQGYPERIFHGDYYANKGVALVRICVPASPTPAAGGDGLFEDVLLYTTHFVAMYQKTSSLLNWRDELYLPARLSQALSVADFITATSRPTDRVIIGGDFNSAQRSLELKTMLILLRQRGYDVSSVLLSPSACRGRVSGGERAISAAVMTFSDENVFNTKEEGWIVQGDDVPAQIDHIFFTSNTLDLRGYDDCPDAACNYPFYTQFDEKTTPMGVVVFTRNDEVMVQPQNDFWTRLGVRRPALKVCPLSDHYGVAARFQLRVGVSAEAERRTTCNQRGLTVELTEEEKEVLEDAVRFLEESVKKMRRESKLCLWFSASIATVVVANVLLLLYHTRHQERHTERILEQLCQVAVLLGSVQTKGGLLNGTSSSWRRWLGNLIPKKQDTSTAAEMVEAEVSALSKGQLDCADAAARIHSRGLWHTLSPVVTICGSLLGAAAFGIALLQRNADAKVLSEQLSMLKRSCFSTDNSDDNYSNNSGGDARANVPS